MILGNLVESGFAELRTGPFGTQLHASDYVTTGRPVLNVRNVGFGEVRSDQLEFVTEQTARRLSGHILKEGDIIFGRKGAVERHAFISERFAGALQGSDCIRLRIAAGAPIRPLFASFALRTHQHQEWMKSYCAHGATMASLNQEILRQVVLPDLPLEAQDRTISVLKALDDLLENGRQRLDLLEQMTEAIYREWFVHFRYPGHEAVDVVDSPLGPIPEGWKIDSCGNALSLQGGGTPSKRIPAYWESGTIPWYTPSDLTRTRHRYAAKPKSKISIAGLEGGSAHLFPAGSVMMTSRATIGVLAIAAEPSTCNQGFIVIKPVDSLPPAFIYEWLSHNAKGLEAIGTGATFKEVTKTSFKRFPFLVPPSPLLTAFSDIATQIEDMIRTIEANTRVIAAVRDLLLPKLITGQIDVSDLDLDALVGTVA